MPRLKRIEIPKNVKEIGESAFCYCQNLEEVIFHDDIHTIRSIAFFRNTSLREIKLPKNLTNLGDYAFAICLSANNIEINENLSEIPRGCFSICSSLKEINIPKNVNKLEEFSFEKCFNLSKINFEGTPKTVEPFTFYDTINIESAMINGEYYEAPNDSYLDILINDGIASVKYNHKDKPKTRKKIK